MYLAYEGEVKGTHSSQLVAQGGDVHSPPRALSCYQGDGMNNSPKWKSNPQPSRLQPQAVPLELVREPDRGHSWRRSTSMPL